MNDSRRERIFNLIGLGLLVLCFCLSLARMMARASHHEGADGKSTIRFAHWQLESGVREAYERLAAEYMKLHPEVQVEQMPVPESVYPNWVRTQLIGGTAPELIELGLGDTTESLATYFDPFTTVLEQPNPYNKDNDLAQTAWRDTFIDGLSHGYNQDLLQYYKIPNSMFTIRMYYNRPLWRMVLGTDDTPQSYEQLMDDCRRAAAYRTAAGERVVPIAASLANAKLLLDRLFSSQTQRLSYSLARPGSVYPGNDILALDFLTGKWSYRTPAVHDALELARSVGQFLPAGFLQLKREDALFTFSQGRALMTVTGSWDAPSIQSQAPFEVGVFDLPVPTSQDPRYGRNIVGVASEAGTDTGLSFGMIKQSSAAKKAQVIDFLHFLTSREANRRFSEYSGWLPAVIGVEVKPSLRPFLPRMDGYPSGFAMNMSQSGGPGTLGPEIDRIETVNMYRLFDTDGGSDVFADLLDGALKPAIIADFNTAHRNQLDLIATQDTTLAAYRGLSGSGVKGAAEWAAKADELGELQTQEEIGVASRRWRLRQLGITLEAQ